MSVPPIKGPNESARHKTSVDLDRYIYDLYGETSLIGSIFSQILSSSKKFDMAGLKEMVSAAKNELQKLKDMLNLQVLSNDPDAKDMIQLNDTVNKLSSNFNALLNAAHYQEIDKMKDPSEILKTSRIGFRDHFQILQLQF